MMPQSLRVKLELVATPNFRVEVPDRRVSVVAGTGAEYLVNADGLGAYTSDVDLSTSSLPTNATSSFSYDPVGIEGSSVATISTTGVAAGTYQFYISGTEWVPAEGIRWAASPGSADIQTAIDSAADGDYVYVPAGSATWTSNVTIPSTKGVKLIGAGQGVTTINFGGYYLRADTRSTNTAVRISGFTFTNCAEYCIRFNPDFTIGATNFRLDNCTFTNSAAVGAKINVSGYTFGVIDHCTFTDMGRCFWVDGQVRPQDITVPYDYPGGYSWKQAVPMGTANAVFFEDNTITNTNASIFFNCRGGARAVFRHNTLTGINGLETHSGCTPGYRNPRWLEMYENTFTISSGTYWCGAFLRSTNGMVYNNTWSSGYVIMSRFDCETICLSTCIGPWPTANKTVYPAQDQIGAGLDTGYGTSQATDEAKLWYWNNTLNGVNTGPSFSSCSESATLIQNDRDYFVEDTSFDGSTGVGVGLLSARPSSGLTTGVYYWATDTSTLYRSTGATTWVTHYTPYTYPHPLAV